MCFPTRGNWDYYTDHLAHDICWAAGIINFSHLYIMICMLVYIFYRTLQSFLFRNCSGQKLQTSVNSRSSSGSSFSICSWLISNSLAMYFVVWVNTIPSRSTSSKWCCVLWGGNEIGYLRPKYCLASRNARLIDANGMHKASARGSLTKF